jgi:hypothetical protein
VIRNIKDLSAYDVLIKIHSKKSLHTGQEQKDWRQRLVRTMVAVKNKVLQPCINLLIKKLEWWAVLRICLLLGKVMAKVLTSCAQGLTWKQGKFFFRGTMFAIRPIILKKLLDKEVSLSDFDGVLEYDMEHAFGTICISQGYEIKALESIKNKKQKKLSKKVALVKRALGIGK